MNAYTKIPSNGAVKGSVNSLNRAGELGDIPNRKERFLSSDSDWFFQTREGAVEGPFKDRNQAGRALGEFLEFLSMATPRTRL